MAKIVDHILPDGTKIKIKEGHKVTQDLQGLGQDTVAAMIAKAEGKDFGNPTVAKKIHGRISKK